MKSQYILTSAINKSNCWIYIFMKSLLGGFTYPGMLKLRINIGCLSALELRYLCGVLADHALGSTWIR